MASPPARRFASIVHPINVPGAPGFAAANIFADYYRFGNEHGEAVGSWGQYGTGPYSSHTA